MWVTYLFTIWEQYDTVYQAEVLFHYLELVPPCFLTTTWLYNKLSVSRLQGFNSCKIK